MDCLDFMPWLEIKQSGEFASALFHLGDYKNCTLKNGDEVSFRIIGFNHDKTRNGIIVPMTWEMTTALPRRYQWNIADNTKGSWKECSLRKLMNNPGEAIFDLFPDDLVEVVTPVIKQTANTFDGSNTIIETEDKFWIISEKELTGRCGRYSAPGEGHWYDYYRLEDVEYGKKRNGEDTWTWLRTPYAGNGYDVRNVSTDGSIDDDRAYSDFGVAPACAI